MKALLDTHVLLWWLRGDNRLSPRVRHLLTDGRNDLFWSAASSWELAIKVSLGRIRFPGPLHAYLPQTLREQRLTPLTIEHSHTFAVAELPMHHRDPFDRLLVAQAQIEGLPLITADSKLKAYAVELLW